MGHEPQDDEDHRHDDGRGLAEQPDGPDDDQYYTDDPGHIDLFYCNTKEAIMINGKCHQHLAQYD